MSRLFTKSSELIGTRVSIGDRVRFADMEYVVVSDHLSNNFFGHSNTDVFYRLGMSHREKSSLCTRIYGYPERGGDFPTTKPKDMEALTKITYYLLCQLERQEEKKNETGGIRKTKLHRLIERGTVEEGDVFDIAGFDIKIRNRYIEVVRGHTPNGVESFLNRLKIKIQDIYHAYDPEMGPANDPKPRIWPEFPNIFGDYKNVAYFEPAYRCMLFLLMREELLFGPQYDEVAEQQEQNEKNRSIQEVQEFIDDATYVIDKMSEESTRLEEEISRLASKRKLMLKESYALRKERREAKRELEGKSA